MSEPSPDSRVWDLLRGALAARAVGIAADLGVARALADGPLPVAELARGTGADTDTLRRVLRALASDGVFAEDEPGVFRNTPASDLLGTTSWGEVAHFFGGAWHRAAGALDASGTPTFPALYGDFWEWLAADPDERAAFDRAMEEGTDRRLARLDSYAWRGDEVVVDLGGGNGSLLTALLARHPGLRGVVFDLSETTVDEAALGDRCTFVAGSFFDRVPDGDAYALSTILHDWSDEQAAAILRTIRVAAKPDAVLLAIEAVVPPGNEPSSSKWMDLLMLVISGGRERDEHEWRTLFGATGWEPEFTEQLIVARPV